MNGRVRVWKGTSVKVEEEEEEGWSRKKKEEKGTDEAEERTETRM